MTNQPLTTCLQQLRDLYTEYTGIEISNAIAQVRAELTAQHAHEQSTESVLTYKYNPDIQKEIGPIVIPETVKKTVKKELDNEEE